MKKNIFQKGVVIFLVLGLGANILSGCAKKEIAFTTGLTKNEVMKIDGLLCTMKEADIILFNLQREYAGLFGNGDWNRKFGDETLGSYVKSQAVKQLSQLRSLSALAQNEGISLSKEDKSAIDSATQEFMNGIDESVKKELDIKSENVQEVYNWYCLSNKFYQQMIESVDAEISDDEARIISIQYMFFSTVKTNENGEKIQFSEQERSDLNSKIYSTLERINSGEDFTKVASENSDDKTVEKSISRGEMTEELEKAAFGLVDGQISELVEVENGIYIIKCISNFDEEKTLENKKKIYKQRCENALNTAYDKYISDVLTEFNEESWNKVKLNNSEGILGLPDLFGVYKKYLQQPVIELN